jgi:hypothetical protein
MNPRPRHRCAMDQRTSHFNNRTEVKEKKNCLCSGSKRDSNPVSAVVISFLNRRHIPLHKQSVEDCVLGKMVNTRIRSLVPIPYLQQVAHQSQQAVHILH